MITEQPQASRTFVLAGLLAALGLIAIGPSYLNHDAAWYLYVADRWIDGAVLYRDLVDTNPPLIIWITALPAAAARVVPLPATLLLKAFVCLVAIVSLLAVRQIVVRHWPSREFTLFTLVTFLAVPFAKEDFAQREHLAILLTLPYVLAAAAPTHAFPLAWQRLLIGVAGGLGFALKPHFLLVFAAVEAFTYGARGRAGLARLEIIGAAAAMGLYGIAVLILTPAYLGVADQVRRVYGEFNASAGALLRLREIQLWIVAAALFAALRWRPGDYLPRATFAAATGFTITALIQFKGWGYHLYPARVFLVLFLGVALLTVLERVPALAAILRGGLRGVATVFAVTLLAISARYVAEARSPATPDLVSPMIESFRSAPPGSVAVLSMRTIIYPAFPAVNYSSRQWGLRQNSLLFLPGFYADQDRLQGGPLNPHTPAEMSDLEREYFTQIVDDLCTARPAVLAFEEPLQKAPAGRRALDLQAYYAQDPRAASLLSAYQPVGSVGPFRMWTRTGEPRCP